MKKLDNRKRQKTINDVFWDTCEPQSIFGSMRIAYCIGLTDPKIDLIPKSVPNQQLERPCQPRVRVKSSEDLFFIVQYA
jgi:hypothetical protein